MNALFPTRALRRLSGCALLACLFVLASTLNAADWQRPAAIHSACYLPYSAYLIDGNGGTGWHHWTQEAHWIVVDLGQSRLVQKLRQWHRQQWDTEYAIAAVYVSDNPAVWGDAVGSLSRIYNQSSGWKEASLVAKAGRYVRLVSEVAATPYWREIEFFTDAASPPIVPPAPLVISNVIAFPNLTAVALSWQTDRASQSVVSYGLTASLGSVVRSAASVMAHEIVLSDLQPGTRYLFRIESTDADGNIATHHGEFTTAVAPPPAAAQVWLRPVRIHSSNDAQRAGNMIDGAGATSWTPAVWLPQPYWVVLDLGAVCDIARIRQWHARQWDTEAAIAAVYVSNDPNNWGESVGSLPRIYNQTPGWKEANVAASTGRYVKLVSEVTNCPYWREIEIYAVPGDPITDPIDPGTTPPPPPPPPPNPADLTPPSSVAAVRDGTAVDLDELLLTDQLSANWDAASDPESGIARYWYAIGTTPGSVNVLNWTNAGTATRFTRTGLALASGATYYVSVRAENGVGLTSLPTVSDGIHVTALAPADREIRLTCASGADIASLIQQAAQQLERIGGGTIYLPEGEFLFTQTVAMSGGINLIGAGLERTILYSQVTGLIDINHNGNQGGSLRISGIAFHGYTSPAGYTHRGISLANIVDFRIDHCYFEGFGYTVNITGRPGYPIPRGVVDHCVIKRGRGVYTSMYGVTAGPWDWVGSERITNLGTQQAVFVEDCYIEGCSHATDGFGGGHYVLRRSIIVDCGSAGGHGPGFEDTGRGIRCTEIYDNRIEKSATASEGLRWVAIGVRGGGGVVFNNTLVNCRYGIQFTMDTGSYPDSDGDGIWDYPALDQTHDKWIWNNTLVNTPVLLMHYGAPAQALILENRDYFLRAPSLELDGFTYTPFTYPHPLTLSGPLSGN